MKIAVFSMFPESGESRELAALLRDRVAGAEVIFCGFEELFYDRAPADMAAAFVCVDNMRSLEGARKIRRLRVPLVIVSSSPDYAPEAFRLGARHYITSPVNGHDVAEAISRCGV